MTLDRYLAGAKGYGQVGYACKPTDADDLVPGRTPWTTLDTLPSFLIAAVQLRRGREGHDLGAGQLRQARRVGAAR